MEEEKDLKDIKLGSIFAYEVVIYACLPAYTFECCIFNPVAACYGCCKPKFFFPCSALNRVDNRDVIFVEIGKEHPAVPKTEFAIGEEFQCGFKPLRCVAIDANSPPKTCNGCFFYVDMVCMDYMNFSGHCREAYRPAATDVIFIEVKPENKEK